MIWNREEVARLLDGVITQETPCDDGTRITVLRFTDALLKYELWVIEETICEGVIIAADPDKPISGLPFFEISLPCHRLGPLPRSGMPTGVGIFSGSSYASVRFTITRREDGNISLSGMWESLLSGVDVNKS